MCYHRACNGVLMNREVIINKIKLNRRYLNNEDLLEQFVNTTIARIEPLIKSIKDDTIKMKLIDKTICRVILDVLKEHNRYYANTKKQKIDYKIFEQINNNHTTLKLSLGKLKQLYSILKKSDKDNNTNYLKILDEMYKNNKTLQEISTLMNVSENDIVDILFEMSEYADKVIQV